MIKNNVEVVFLYVCSDELCMFFNLFFVIILLCKFGLMVGIFDIFNWNFELKLLVCIWFDCVVVMKNVNEVVEYDCWFCV